MNNEPVNVISEVTSPSVSLPPILKLPLVSDSPCINFVNTIDWRLLPERCHDSLVAYSDLLAFALRLNLLPIASYTSLAERAQKNSSAAERSLNDARAFRDALTSLIDDMVDKQKQARQKEIHPEALAIFDAARRRARESESLVWIEDRFTLFPHPEEEGLDLPWLILVRDAERLLCSPEASHIRICAAEGCGWAFLDQSKNGSRRWCSMKLCGNREKVARFKAKGGSN
jgi:predicted RNA-binding Zn ribbon-like protein